ncbi:hypothetical protein FQN53_001185 [Emmonsiellopsis sp. PD_33]|nr:hypothetical protein FQN53_001185 [Emmonsiellopsis sp. PD_33]
MSYDRVLPKPPTLHYDPTRRDLPTRTSTPVEHQIMTDKFSKIVADESAPRSTGLESRALVAALAEKSTLIEVPSTILASPIARKRTSSLITSEAFRQERAASSSSSKSTSSKESNSIQFCLCQPDPKIPRPRNAFILFRQHFQASVVAQNPGLANPEISKIIGEKWRTLPQDSKQDWKNLAEEEKARHQQQYPDYRYQPRRYGRNSGNVTPTSSGISNNPTGASVCNRCGGRVMNPPSTPNTPFTPNSTSSTASSCQSSQAIPRSFRGRRLGDDNRLPSPVQVPGSMDRRIVAQMRDQAMPPCPDIKRRRYNGNGIYVPVRHDQSPDTPYAYSPRRTSLPRPEILHPRGPGPYQTAAAPPGRAYRLAPGHQQSSHDPSLTLPPLQTMSLSQQNQSTVEAMVMNIPHLNKIKVLARVSPPTTLSKSTDSPARGALVAVEGQDPESVKFMIQHLQALLSKDEKHQVRVFEGPDPSKLQSSGRSGDRDATVQYLEYLATISAWHKISGEILTFINGSPAPSPRLQHAGLEEPGSGISPKSIVPKTAQLRISSPDASSAGAPSPLPTPTSASTSAPSASSAPTSTSTTSPFELPFRIALVPRYQLTTADTHACAAPIKDSYAPIDHWQWMATLWRGCAGPDVTIYIRDCEKEELEKYGGNPVEIRLDEARALVVRRVAEAGLGIGIEEKALRRVGFEVEEFLRK